MTGNEEGVIRSMVIRVFGGRLFLISLILDSINCWLVKISAFQSRKAEISQLPRLVVLRIPVRSGIFFIVSSSNRVTVTIILSTGCSPLSAMILILGKVTRGNRELC